MVGSLGAGAHAHACPREDARGASGYRPSLEHRARAPISLPRTTPQAVCGDPLPDPVSVCSYGDYPMNGDRTSGPERLPGRLRAALGCGLAAVVLEASLDRVAGDFVVEALQRAADSRGAPGRGVVRHADHEGGEVRLGAGATGDSLLRAGVFLGDEPAVLTEDRVRGDDAREVPEAMPTERLSLHSQAAPLVVGEPEPAATALRAQDAGRVFAQDGIANRTFRRAGLRSVAHGYGPSTWIAHSAFTLFAVPSALMLTPSRSQT
jgi:hypothetical protein